MKNILKIALFLAAILPFTALAQQYSEDEDDKEGRQRKLGVRLGVGVFGMRSEPLPSDQLIDTLPAIGFTNNRLEFGYTASAYLRTRLSKSFHLQIEVGGTLKGARFANGISEYSRITLLSLDVPIYGMINLVEDDKLQFIFGPQVSFNINSQMYIGKEVVASFVKLPIKTLDLFAVGGLQYNGSMVGLQLTFKWGLRDINNGFQTWNLDGQFTGTGSSPDEIRPTIRNVGRISTFGIEFGISF